MAGMLLVIFWVNLALTLRTLRLLQKPAKFQNWNQQTYRKWIQGFTKNGEKITTDLKLKDWLNKFLKKWNDDFLRNKRFFHNKDFLIIEIMSKIEHLEFSQFLMINQTKAGDLSIH